jgi:hypothetical protein
VKASARQALIGLAGLAVVLIVIAVMASNANTDTGLRVQVLSARRTEPGSTEPFTVTVADTKGAVRSVKVDFGDGHVEDLPVEAQPCKAPLVRKFTTEHAFDFTGFTTISATVVTDGCGAGREQVEAIRTIEVRKVRR